MPHKCEILVGNVKGWDPKKFTRFMIKTCNPELSTLLFLLPDISYYFGPRLGRDTKVSTLKIRCTSEANSVRGVDTCQELTTLRTLFCEYYKDATGSGTHPINRNSGTVSK